MLTIGMSLVRGKGSGGRSRADRTDTRGNRDRNRKAEEGMSHAFGCAAWSDAFCARKFWREDMREGFLTGNHCFMKKPVVV